MLSTVVNLAQQRTDGSDGYSPSQLSRAFGRSSGETQRACHAQCQYPGTPNKHPARTAVMEYPGRDLPPRILHAARRLQLCGGTQAAARIAGLLASSFHPRIFPHVLDGGRAQNRRARPRHVHIPATRTPGNPRQKGGRAGPQGTRWIDAQSAARKVRASPLTISSPHTMVRPPTCACLAITAKSQICASPSTRPRTHASPRTRALPRTTAPGP